MFGKVNIRRFKQKKNKKLKNGYSGGAPKVFHCTSANLDRINNSKLLLTNYSVYIHDESIFTRELCFCHYE